MRTTAAVLGALLVLGGLDRAAQAGEDIEVLIRNAAADRQHVPALMRQLLSQPVYIIARLDSPRAIGMRIQDFMREGRSFIPVFSDEAHFQVETRGSGFEGQGVAMDADLFASILRGDELLVLNPGSSTPVDLDAQDLKAFVDRARLPKGGI